MSILKPALIAMAILAMITPATVQAQTAPDGVRIPFIGWRDGRFVDETIDPVQEPSVREPATGPQHPGRHRHAAPRRHPA